MTEIKKRRHHYVWRNYLKAWSKNGKIFCLLNGIIVNPSLMGVGQQRDFYKLPKLASADIEFIKKIIHISPKESVEQNIELLSIFALPHHLLESTSAKSDDQLNKIEVLICNLNEDIHQNIENMGGKYLKLLLNEDTSFFSNDDDCANFIHYLCIQYLRTKNIRDKVIAGLKPLNTNVNFEAIWQILTHIFGRNMGSSIYEERNNFKLVLIKNISTVDFLTGDQPVINIFSLSQKNNEPPARLAFYHPISPKLAIMVIEKSYFFTENTLHFDEAAVLSHNKAIAEKSSAQIYALNQATLAPFLIKN